MDKSKWLKGCLALVGWIIALTVFIAACSPTQVSPTPTVFVPAKTPEPITPSPLLTEPTGARATVLRIIDGDTILVRVHEPGTTMLEQERVRLIGIDAAERGSENPCAERAIDLVGERTPPGSTVGLVLDREHRDRYGRLLAYVFYLDSNEQEHWLNWDLLFWSVAVPLEIPPNTSYADQLQEGHILGGGVPPECSGDYYDPGVLG